MTQLVLVIAAHPDDEVLGCGASIARHAALGDDVHILIVAEGATSRSRNSDAPHLQREIDHLRSCATDAADVLGVNSPRFGGLPDNRLDSVDRLEIIKLVEALIDESRRT